MAFEMKKKVDNLRRIVLPKNMRDYYRISLNEKVNLIPTKRGILITKCDGSDSEEKPANDRS